MDTAEARTTTSGAAGDPIYDAFLSYSHAADELLAPRLQSGLQRFAKPWWKRRALRIFRDEASLSANPHLWSSITDALDESGWFVLLLSPEAAGSAWVNREVDYWLEHKDPDRIIPVVTEGEFTWADTDLNLESTAAPPALYGAFSDEPRWVDLRFAHTEEQLDLKNPRFSAAVADIASAIRGVPKDELESEEVRQHRRTVRTAWAAGIVVVLFAVVAGAAALFAIDQRNEAQEQQSAAEAATAAEAEQRAEADRQRLLAEQAAGAEAESARVAEARALGAAAQAALDEDPELSVMLAGAAVEIDPTRQHVTTLHQALQQHRPAALTVEWTPERKSLGIHTGSLSVDGRRIGIAGVGNEIEVWDVDDPSGPLWTKEFDGEAAQIWEVWFTEDRSKVVVFVYWSYWAQDEEGNPLVKPSGFVERVVVLDAESGEELQSIATPPCFGGIGQAPVTLDLPLLAFSFLPVDGGCDFDAIVNGPFDLATGTFLPVTPAGADTASMSSDGRYLAYGGPDSGAVVDIETGEEIFVFDGGMAILSADGDLIIIGGGGSGSAVELWGVHEGERWFALGTDLDMVVFGAGGAAIVAIDDENRVRFFDVASGDETATVRGTTERSIIDVFLTEDGNRLALFGESVRVLDVVHPVQGEVAVHDVGPSGFRLLDTLETAGGSASSHTWDWIDTGRAWVTIFKPETGEMVLVLDALSKGALSADGSKVAIQPMLEDIGLTDEETAGFGNVYQTIGPIRVVDVEAGTFVEMQGLCEWYNGVWTDNEIPGPDCGEYPQPLMDWVQDIALSPDGSLVAIGGVTTNSVTVWDAEIGALLWNSGELENQDTGIKLAFSPSGEQLAVGSIFRLRIFDAETGVLIPTGVIDPATNEPLPALPLDQGLRSMVFSPDGSRLYGIIAAVSADVLVWDAKAWEPLAPIEGTGNPMSLAISPGGEILAVGAPGLVTILDVETGATLQAIPLNSDWVSNVAFVDSTHLMVTPLEPGPIFAMTLDPDELVAFARSRITRGYTPEECATHDLDPCPTLVDIQSGSA